LFVTSLNAQFSAEFLKYHKLHPEDARVRLQQETIITITVVNDSLQIHQEFYVENKVDKFTEKDELNQSFHDDSTLLNFVYPNLKKGSKSRLKYSQEIKNPRFLTPFYFGDYFPVEQNKVTIIANYIQ